MIVHSLPSCSNPIAPSAPTRPPPMITTFFPSFSGCNSASIAIITFSLSIPLIGGTNSSDPIATTSASGSNSFTTSGVTSLLSNILTPAAFVRFSKTLINFNISSLK